jgi:hypothetical protein
VQKLGLELNAAFILERFSLFHLISTRVMSTAGKMGLAHVEMRNKLHITRACGGNGADGAAEADEADRVHLYS